MYTPPATRARAASPAPATTMSRVLTLRWSHWRLGGGGENSWEPAGNPFPVDIRMIPSQASLVIGVGVGREKKE